MFYILAVVGGDVNCKDDIYGGEMECAVTFRETHNDGWIYIL